MVPFSNFTLPGTTGSACVRVGPIDRMRTSGVLNLLPTLRTWPAPDARDGTARLRGAGLVLGWLEAMPGTGGEQRRSASGADQEGKDWIDVLVDGQPGRSPAMARGEIVSGMASLLLVRLVLPSYDFLVGSGAVTLFTHVRSELQPDVFAQAENATRTRGMAGRP